MQTTAALIQFPEPSMLAVAGIAVVACSLLFGLFGNSYVKKRTQKKASSRMHHEAILEIYEDKKLGESEVTLMNRVLDQFAPENPLRAVTTREGFGLCVEAEMNRVTREGDRKSFKETGVKLRDIRNALGLDYIPIGKPVYSSRELHVGQVISVALEKDKNPIWVRMVVRAIDEAGMYISRASESTMARFDDGDEVICKLWRDEDAQYNFSSRISIYGEAHAEWSLRHNAEKMDRSQSREHFRMRYEQNTNVGILNASAHEDSASIKSRSAVTQFRGKITSLSAGGCAIVFQQAIAKHVFLRIELELPDQSPFLLESRIIASSSISGGRCLVRARFIGTTEQERDSISRFLRQKQQETMLPDNA